MDQLKTYQRTSIKSGWTRIEMLLMLYERAIGAIESCEIANEVGDQSLFHQHELTARKTIMAIHAGLKPEEDDVAYNIARLLHFVMVRFDQKDFKSCRDVLEEIRSGFSQIAEEANQLEREGTIPALPESDTFESLA